MKLYYSHIRGFLFSPIRFTLLNFCLEVSYIYVICGHILFKGGKWGKKRKLKLPIVTIPTRLQYDLSGYRLQAIASFAEQTLRTTTVQENACDGAKQPTSYRLVPRDPEGAKIMTRRRPSRLPTIQQTSCFSAQAVTTRLIAMLMDIQKMT